MTTFINSLTTDRPGYLLIAIMNSIATHVVKRGMEAHETFRTGAKHDDAEENPISPLLATCLAATVLLFVVASNLVSTPFPLLPDYH